MRVATDPVTLSVIAAAFFLAGLVKGVVGFGLPPVSLALLTTTLGLQPAVALLLAPAISTNAWQATVGGNGRAILSRIWPFLFLAGARTVTMPQIMQIDQDLRSEVGKELAESAHKCRSMLNAK